MSDGTPEAYGTAGSAAAFRRITSRYGVGNGAGAAAGSSTAAHPGGQATNVPPAPSSPPYDSFNLGLAVGDDPVTVQRHRAHLAAVLGLPPSHLVWMSQVHGTAVADVPGPRAEPVPHSDGMVCAVPGIGLAVLVADCVPVLAADRAAGVLGAAHAGRVGAAGGIVPRLLERMTAAGARRGDIEVLIGPAVCGRCYEVPADMRDEVEAHLPGSACLTAEGTAGIDLRAGLVRQLRAAGIARVDVDERCTREDADLFSHRRSGRTGRFAAVIWQ